MVMRSRKVTWRGVMENGICGETGLGYGGAPEVRYKAGAVGSSSMAGILLFDHGEKED